MIAIAIAVASGCVACASVLLLARPTSRGARFVIAIALLVAITGVWIQSLVRYELDRHPPVTINCYATSRAAACTVPKVGP